MKLYLMRHGDYEQNAIPKQQALNEKGKQAVRHLAQFLQSMKLQVAEILHSDLLRAKQTAELIAAANICATSPQFYPGLHPQDAVAPLIDAISIDQTDKFIIGHLPYLSRLLSKLILGDENRELVIFDTATLVCLHEFSRDRWLIEWVLHPTLFSHSAIKAS